MKGLVRWFRHRWFDPADVRRALPEAALARLEARVRASEARHSGEIRLCIEAGLPSSYLWKRLGVRERALAMFGKLRVWDTEHNNGVLIYLLLAERAIEIVADRGIHSRVERGQWEAVVEAMREPLRQGRFEEGLRLAIDAIEPLLVEHFPLAPGQERANELPDRPWVG
jgi:uncharacterized membrane protein